MRTAQFARILVLDIGGRFQRVMRASHAASRRRRFASWDGHINSNWQARPPAPTERAKMESAPLTGNRARAPARRLLCSGQAEPLVSKEAKAMASRGSRSAHTTN